MTSTTEEGDSINLISKEGDVFEVPRSVGMISQLVMETLGDDDDDDDDYDEDVNGDGGDKNNSIAAKKNIPEIPLPNVEASILVKVIEFCKYYQTVEPMTPIKTPLKGTRLDEMVQPWYAEYVKVDRNVLFDLVNAANFMDIKPLLDLTCLAVSILIKGKSAAELREMFNIPNEFNSDEEIQIQKENSWIENQTQSNNNNDKNNNNNIDQTPGATTSSTVSSATPE